MGARLLRIERRYTVWYVDAEEHYGRLTVKAMSITDAVLKAMTTLNDKFGKDRYEIISVEEAD